jgi:prostaglandin-endoperoxide synthase 2
VARNIVIVCFIKVVVEDYISHIAPAPFGLLADPSVAWRAVWNRPNWITTEFSLLYRWHSLVPAEMSWAGIKYPVGATFMNNQVLLATGLGPAFVELSGQKANALGAMNTAEALMRFEESAIRQGRLVELAPYADYRRYAGLKAAERFEDVSGNPDVVAELRRLYASPEQIDFYVGLFMEDTQKNGPLPQLLQTLVAVDAFSQALTNPLLSEHVFKEDTFSPMGWQVIADTHSLRQIVERNAVVPQGAFIGMTQPDWRYSW